LLTFLLRGWLRGFAKLHVRAKPPVHHVDVLSRGGIDAKTARPFGLRAHELQRSFDRERRGRKISGERRGTTRAPFANLHERTEPSDADANRLAALGLGPEIEQGIVRSLLTVLDSGEQ